MIELKGNKKIITLPNPQYLKYLYNATKEIKDISRSRHKMIDRVVQIRDITGHLTEEVIKMDSDLGKKVSEADKCKELNPLVMSFRNLNSESSKYILDITVSLRKAR